MCGECVTLVMFSLPIHVMCTEDADHQGDHYDKVFSKTWAQTTDQTSV